MTKPIVILLVLAALGVSAGEARADAAGSTDVGALREQCTKAMNADPGFAKSIVIVAENQYRKARLQQIDKENCTIAVHQAEEKAIAKNERHVILAYAAMWVIAAGFLMMLWRRQQRLVAEIGQLHRDLAEATAVPAPAAVKPAAKKVEPKVAPKKVDETKPEPKVEASKVETEKADKKADKADDKKADKADDKKADDDGASKDPVTKDDD
jgi:hypothetical protein